MALGDKAFVFASITGFFGLAIGLLAGVSVFENIGIVENQAGKSFLRYMDPLLIQGFAFLHCVLCLSRSNPSQMKGDLKARWFYSTLTVAMVFVLFYVVNDLVFKMSLERPRPPLEYRNSLGIFMSKFEGGEAGAPSGFSSRGTMLVLLSTLASMAIPKTIGRFRNWVFSPLVVFITQSCLLFFASAHRVWTGFHYWFDVFLGIALTIPVFWIVLLLFSWKAIPTLPQGMNPQLSDSWKTLIITLIVSLSLLGFFYSGDAETWVGFVLVLWAVGILLTWRMNIRLKVESAKYVKGEE